MLDASITVSSAAVYGFTDMVTFFRTAPADRSSHGLGTGRYDCRKRAAAARTAAARLSGTSVSLTQKASTSRRSSNLPICGPAHRDAMLMYSAAMSPGTARPVANA